MNYKYYKKISYTNTFIFEFNSVTSSIIIFSYRCYSFYYNTLINKNLLKSFLVLSDLRFLQLGILYYKKLNNIFSKNVSNICKEFLLKL